jgi:hypothetical protein
METWAELSKCLQKEKTILGPRNTPENLKIIHDSRLAVVKIQNKKIVSFVAFWPTDSHSWLEAGSAWVSKIHRGKKYASEAFKKLMTLIPDGKRVFAITHSVPQIVHLLKKEGFIEIPACSWDREVPFEVTCNPCDNQPNINCPKKGEECKLYLFPR